MKNHLLISFVSIALFSTTLLHAQLISNDNYTGSWSNTSSWSTSTPGNPVSVASDIDVYGYITVNGNLNLDNPTGGDLYYLTVYDTLVVTGSTITENQAHGLVIPAGGLVVIFGNYEVNNQVDIDNGGVLVVMGDLTINGGAGTDYINGGGSLYVDGDINGSNTTAIADASSVNEPIENLDNGDPADQNLYDFITSGGSNPLPITLSEFLATPDNNTVVLNWTTLTEKNFDYFEVQRAGADGEFEVVARVAGSGESKEAKSYSWTDESPLLGINYYRLESVDFDGYRETFETRMVLIESVAASAREIAVGPNPARANGLISFSNLGQEEIDFQIYDLQGHLQLSGTTGDMDKIQLPASITKGIYIISYETNGWVKKDKLVVR
ncbi:T9SS type A sorting domain-containing protein [Marinoscillum sp. MHG1-6]|uniref:T9SS type A sorting domain-containing protein n=1 Tax=Marinoscillum sp. MHG1-6 TaxID=2959627 RepID=UPI0021570BB7|nr:T9SS type A sorting domain-containing protein [Marinoscillum sp. MHG1-6]